MKGPGMRDLIKLRRDRGPLPTAPVTRRDYEFKVRLRYIGRARKPDKVAVGHWLRKAISAGQPVGVLGVYTKDKRSPGLRFNDVLLKVTSIPFKKKTAKKK